MRGCLPAVACFALLCSGSTPGPSAGLDVRGSLAPDEIQKVMQKEAPRVRKCYDDRLKGAPGLMGRVNVRWTIGGDGAVSKVWIEKKSSTLLDEALVHCISGVIKSWQFPAPKSGTVEVSFPYEFGLSDLEAEKRAELQSLALGNKDAAASSADAPGAHGSGGAAAHGETRGGEAYGRPAERTRSTPTESAPPPTSAPVPKAPRPAKMKGAPKPDSAAAEPAPAATSGRTVEAPAMKAGRHDDNKQYNRFLEFLNENKGYVTYPAAIEERLVIKVLDQNGKSVPNCTVEVKSTAGNLLATSTTYADGTTHFFPGEAGAKLQDYVTSAKCGRAERNGQLPRRGRRVNELLFGFARSLPAHMPVDIAIVLDTTGSMQSQIDRLKKTLAAIHYQLTELSTKPDIRFALVAYRDRGDDYVTAVTPFTSDVGLFQSKLDALQADGGGDTPEDLQGALEKAMKELDWRKEALRVGFVVADAIPHTDYGQTYNYREAMREALRRGIKWVTVGAGGLPREGEVIFRQIAQYTMGEYVFVTEAGGGDAEGGTGEASHHVGTNYSTENLDQAIVRIVRRELSYLTDEPRDFDYTINASVTPKSPRDEVLAPAVAEVLRQLTDYSSLKLAAKTPVAVVPVTVSGKQYADVGGYLSDQMVLSTSRNPSFKVVERDLAALAQEQKLQLSELFDVEEAIPIGRLIGAEVLIVSKLTVSGDAADLYAKMIRVETGEVLSAAKVHVTGGLAGS